jgi:hypothetical protein
MSRAYISHRHRPMCLLMLDLLTHGSYRTHTLCAALLGAYNLLGGLKQARRQKDNSLSASHACGTSFLAPQTQTQEFCGSLQTRTDRPDDVWPSSLSPSLHTNRIALTSL